MLLQAWMEETNLAIEQVARLCDVHRTQVKRWIDGALPRRKHMEVVFRQTRGKVGPDDFYKNSYQQQKRRERAQKSRQPARAAQ